MLFCSCISFSVGTNKGLQNTHWIALWSNLCLSTRKSLPHLWFWWSHVTKEYLRASLAPFAVVFLCSVVFFGNCCNFFLCYVVFFGNCCNSCLEWLLKLLFKVNTSIFFRVAARSLYEGYSKSSKTNSKKYFIYEIYKIIFLHSFHPIS